MGALLLLLRVLHGEGKTSPATCMCAMPGLCEYCFLRHHVQVSPSVLPAIESNVTYSRTAG